MEVRKHNARKITETFEYRTEKAKIPNLPPWGQDIPEGYVYKDYLKEFEVAGEEGKISLTYDERDKQQVVDLLRAMADSLDTEKVQVLRECLQRRNIPGWETATFDDWDMTLVDGEFKPVAIGKLELCLPVDESGRVVDGLKGLKVRLDTMGGNIIGEYLELCHGKKVENAGDKKFKVTIYGDSGEEKISDKKEDES